MKPVGRASRRFGWLATATAVLGAGCDSARARPDDGRVEAVTRSETTRRPRLTSRGEVEQAARRLVEAAGPHAMALELRIRDRRAALQVERADRPGEMVQFTLSDGRVSGPVPIELRGKGDLGSNLFPLRDVNLSALPALVRLAVDRVDRSDGQVSSVLLRRNLPHSEDVLFRVFVDSPRKNGSLDADQNGKPLD